MKHSNATKIEEKKNNNVRREALLNVTEILILIKNILKICFVLKIYMQTDKHP